MKAAEVDFMIASGQKKVQAGTFTVSVRETPSCEITDEAKIPLMYTVQVPATTRPDKKAILQALKDGQTVTGAQLHYRRSVTVK
jgi:hypothetical protein